MCPGKLYHSKEKKSIRRGKKDTGSNTQFAPAACGLSLLRRDAPPGASANAAVCTMPPGKANGIIRADGIPPSLPSGGRNDYNTIVLDTKEQLYYNCQERM